MARILLTEPDRAIREFIAGILTEFGHDVVASGNIVEAEVWLATSPMMSWSPTSCCAAIKASC
jgi:hypothetical protein